MYELVILHQAKSIRNNYIKSRSSKISYSDIPVVPFLYDLSIYIVFFIYNLEWTIKILDSTDKRTLSLRRSFKWAKQITTFSSVFDHYTKGSGINYQYTGRFYELSYTHIIIYNIYIILRIYWSYWLNVRNTQFIYMYTVNCTFIFS